ncbi:hypothetical protein DOM21_09200 [Bacteriovorax stolpii]|uniref:Uncharacterized protein n=1 Tax=Bacteriovorax stolpii TaxID=960 RepID=A0A2K9NS93_BACTC|nr:hypothetical protein [Bacteriovorax stolpii]AUN98396.1 hypothetical protein C0V70_09815 [Bacteriovorax stolpii]QDK41624.1 hypothetical protein DOM21_09200 [Bacteriovorax stolpii]TDP50983.1 hypothetical protein C8D79_3722 [Bacteriovorax stolpii]
MKKHYPIILLSLSLSTMLAFKAGDEIELDSFLNARANPNFLRSAANIKTTLKKGTTGDVLEIKKFSSGNSGIKIKVTSGTHAGESYWVYYNKNNPAIKLTDKKQKDSTTPERLNLKDSPRSETLRDTAAVRDLTESALVQTSMQAQTLTSTVNETLTPPVLDCPPKVETKPEVVLSSVPEDNYQVSDLVAPFRDRPGVRQGYPGCRNTSSNPIYAVCRVGAETNPPDGFKIFNGGPNAIVATNEYYINRTFEFDSPDRARSDMKLMISDAPDDTTSHTTYSIMLFFPRTSLPSIKEVGNELHVTLPNGEAVQYNAKTGEIIGGVLTEGKMAQDPKNKNKAFPPAVKYNGSGVVIRADKSGDLPYGDIELRDGSSAPSVTIATVSKKGHKDCKIPSKDIWYNDAEKKDVLIRPEYATDAGLDSFLKKKCGFSLF